MAGTADDDTTLDWVLLGAARALTTEYTFGSYKRAEEILLSGLEWGMIRWKPVGELRFQDPHGVWTRETAMRFFFDRLGPGRIDVDWDNHGVVRTGPAQVPMGEKGARVLNDGPQTVIEAPLILVCWNDVLDILRVYGLVPRSSDSAAAALTPPQQTSPPEPSSQPQPEPSPEPSPQSQSPQSSPALEQQLPKKWEPEEAEEWLQQLLSDHPRGRNKMKWVREVAFPKMQGDFEDKAPWNSVESLYRRLFPRKTGRGRGRPRK